MGKTSLTLSLYSNLSFINWLTLETYRHIKKIMLMEKEVMYVPPKVEVIHVEVEKGFSNSFTGDNGGNNPF